MKLLILFCTTFILTLTQLAQAQCPNGNAEQGTLNLWETGTGFFPTDIKNFTSPSNRIRVIQNTGTWNDETIINNIDKYGSFKVPSEGIYAFRLGDSNIVTPKNGLSEIMWYKFKVTQTNALFKFRFAMVLEDGTHPPSQQPFLSMFMNLTGNNNKPHLPKVIPLNLTDIKDKKIFNKTEESFVADLSNPFFKISPTLSPRKKQVIYKSWQCKEINLTDFIGEDVLICFRISNCEQGGHFAFAYIDGLCDNWPATASFTLSSNQFCSNNTPIFFNGSSSSNEEFYQIIITESYNSTGTQLNQQNVISETFLGKVSEQLDLKQWYINHGRQWKCNTYYQVKLVTANSCSMANESVQMIKYTCPSINAGRDTILCCKDALTPPITIGTYQGGVTPPNTYDWVSSPSGTSSTSAQTAVQPTESTIYTLTLTDYYGCQSTDDVSIEFQGKIKLRLEYDSTIHFDCSKPQIPPLNCDPKIYAIPTPLDCKGNELTGYWLEKQKKELTYLWNTGETSASIFPKGGYTYYSVEVRNKCKVVRDTIWNIPYPSYFSQQIIDNVNQQMPFTPMIAPNSFTPNGDGVNDEFVIKEYVPGAANHVTTPAYHSYQYELTIYDRWGTVVQTKNSTKIKTIRGCANNGFLTQGEIKWDGKDNNGKLVQIGVYVYQLKLWNCVAPQGKSPSVLTNGHCGKYAWRFTLFPFPHIERQCVKWISTPSYISGSAATVTVIY